MSACADPTGSLARHDKVSGSGNSAWPGLPNLAVRRQGATYPPIVSSRDDRARRNCARACSGRSSATPARILNELLGRAHRADHAPEKLVQRRLVLDPAHDDNEIVVPVD